MGYYESFSKLCNAVLNCQKNTCPRFGCQPFIFERKNDTPATVKILFLSEEIPANYKERKRQDIISHLRSECLTRGGIVPSSICAIIGRNFDPLEDEDVYWTMGLKCIPNKNHYEVESTIENCREYLFNEILLMPQLKYIVAFGENAFLALNKINSLPSHMWNKKFSEIVNNTPVTGFEMQINGRNIAVSPLFHPSHDYIHYNKSQNHNAKKLKEHFIEILSKECRR